MLVVTHVVSAIGALLLGAAALRFPNGTPRHRAIGTGYVFAWIIVAGSGLALGVRHPGISAFEILTIFGATCVAFAFAAVRLRRKLGPRWLRWHYVWMTASIAALVITSVNQTILQTYGAYPRWIFWTLVLSPIAVLPAYHRRLDRRYLPAGNLTRRYHAARADLDTSSTLNE